MTHRVKRDLGKIKQEVFDQNVHDYKDDAYKHRGVTGFDDNFGALPDMSNVFRKACKPQKYMTKQVFLKICEDAGLVDDKACTLDHLFHIYRRVQGTQDIYIDQVGFELALHYISKKKGVGAVTIYNQVYQMTVTKQETLQQQGKLVTKGTHDVCFTFRELIPKVLCAVPPEAAPAWQAVPAKLILEAEGKIPAKNSRFYGLSIVQKQAAEMTRVQLEKAKFQARKAALRGEGPVEASFGVASAVTLWPEKVHKAVSKVRAARGIFTPVGYLRRPFENTTRPETGATARLGLCESCPDLANKGRARQPLRVR